MIINASTGYVQWPDATPTGSYPITIQVTDLAGLYDQQAYTLVVSTTAPGYPPVFASTPPFYAAVNLAYQYTALANDPQGGNVTYTYATSPSMSNFSVNSTTGVVTWIPNSSELGTETITITATDTLGLTAVQNFNVSVVTSLPPTISSGTPPSTITAGLTFIYQIQASDPAGDTLTYSLIAGAYGHGDRLIRAHHLADDEFEHRLVFLRSEGRESGWARGDFTELSAPGAYGHGCADGFGDYQPQPGRHQLGRLVRRDCHRPCGNPVAQPTGQWHARSRSTTTAEAPTPRPR